MADSYQPTYWVDKSTPAINATNLRKIEKGIADAHGIADGTVGSTGTVDRIIIIDGAGHYLQIPSLTTTQRDALPAKNGMILYNSTLKCLQTRRDGAWVDLHAGTIREDLNLGGNKITSLGAPIDDADAATKQYVDLRPSSSAIVANAYLSGASWYRTDPTKPAWMVQVNSISDLCQIRRAPPGSGAIVWDEICQVDSGGLRPRICVPSDELRYTGSPGGTGGYGWVEAATLISKRVPSGAPYYGAGHYQMGIRIRATLTSSTLRPDMQGTTITFTLYVDGVAIAAASASHGNPGYIVADAQVNPYSLIEIRTPRYSAHNSPVHVAVSEFTISATDVNAQATGWS